MQIRIMHHQRGLVIASHKITFTALNSRAMAELGSNHV